MDTRCQNTACSLPAEATLEGKPYCRQHFILDAYSLLDRASERLEHAAFHGPEAESVMHALEECMHATTSLAIALEKPENLERAQLMDILLWATDLCRRMRRGPRKCIAIPILLRSDVPGRTWREEVATMTISRYGGCVVCAHEAAYSDAVQVRRKDIAQEAAARVVWARRLESGSFEIGFELVDEDNFWRLDWARENA